MTDDDSNPWDWAILRSKDGDIIPPGACEGYHTGGHDDADRENPVGK